MKATAALTSMAARPHGLRCHWFKGWNRALDDALQALPPMPGCPPDIFKELACHPAEVPKRLGLVLKSGEPLAVLSLRRRKNFWEPVTSMCIPGADLPAAPGALGDAFRACGLRVSIEELYVDPYPLHPTTVHVWDVHLISLQEDYTEFWKRSKLWRNVAHSRNRTAHMELCVDNAADIDWTIDRWAEIWKTDPEELWTTASDMKVAARWLNEQGLAIPITLRENGERVAGMYNIAMGPVLHAMVDARAVDRPTDHTGNRILDVSMEVARDRGFEKYDIGGLVEYKKRWAPAETTRSTVFFEPFLLRAPRSVKLRSKAMWRRIARPSSAPVST